MKATATPSVTPKKKTKEQRCREHAKEIFSHCITRMAEVISSMPEPPTNQKINKMINNRLDLSVDAAAIFEESWSRYKGRFIEEGAED